jgi:hypothetical protein
VTCSLASLPTEAGEVIVHGAKAARTPCGRSGRSVSEGAAARAPRLGPDPIRNREEPRCGRA